MGFLDRVNKIWSGADFWDKQENAKQRVQYQQQDEERKRREAQARAQANRPQPQFQPPQPQFQPPQPQFQPQQQQQQPTIQEMVAAPLQKYQSVAPNPEQVKAKELEALKQKHMARALEEGKRDTSWFDRQFTDRNWNKRAEAMAINRATREYQDKNGWTKDKTVLDYQKGAGKKLDEAQDNSGSKWLAPVISAGRVGTGIAEGFGGLYDLATPGKGTNRFTQAANKKAVEQDQLAKDFDIEGAYKTGNVVGEIASYAIPGAIAAKGAKGASATAKGASMVGKYGSKVDDIAKMIDKGGDANKIRQFIATRVRQNFTVEEAIQELMITGRYMGQNTARGGDTSIQSVATDAAMGLGGALLVPARGFKQLFNNVDGAGQSADDVAGAGLAGGTEYLDDALRKGDIPTTPDVPKAPNPSGIEVSPGVISPNLLNNPVPPAAVDVPTQPPVQAPTPVPQTVPTTPPVQQQLDIPTTPRVNEVPQIQPIEVPQTPMVQAPTPVQAVPEAAPIVTPGRVASEEVIQNTAPVAPAPAPVRPNDADSLRGQRESLLAERDARAAEGLPTVELDRRISQLNKAIDGKASKEATVLAEGDQQLAEAEAPARVNARPEVSKAEAPKKPQKGVTTRQMTPEEMAEKGIAQEQIDAIMAKRGEAPSKPEPVKAEAPAKPVAPTSKELNAGALENTLKSGKVSKKWKDEQKAAGATDEQIAKAVEKVEGRKVEPTAEEKMTAEQRAKANEIAKTEKAKAKAEGRTEQAAPELTKALSKNTTKETGDEAARAAIERGSKAYKKDFNFEAETKKAQDVVDTQSDGNVLKWAEDVMNGKKAKDVEGVDELLLGDAIGSRLEKLRRAGTLTYDDTVELITKIGRNTASASSNAGLTNRVVRELYKSLPSPLRVQKEVEKLTKHYESLGVEFKVGEDDTKRLVELTDNFDEASTRLTGLEQEMATSMADMLDPPGDMTPQQISDNFKDLAKQRVKAQEDAIASSKEYMNKLQDLKPKLGAKNKVKDWTLASPDVAGNYLRMSMLSAPSGRIRDVVSTSANVIDQVGWGLIESLTGKVSNTLFKTNLESSIISKSAVNKGRKGAWSKLKSSWKGEYTLDEATGKVGVTDRSELKAGDGISQYGIKHGRNDRPRKGIGKFLHGAAGLPRKVIATAVQAPTDASYNAYTQKLYNIGLAKAKASGLSGKPAKQYADMFMERPDEKSALKAADKWLENSGMHKNFISDTLTKATDWLDTRGMKKTDNTAVRFAKKATARSIRTTTIPFVQYMGGATHSMLIKQNPLVNVSSAVIAAAKKDPQLAVENMARAGWNTAKIGTLTALVGSKVIETSDTDADGKTNYNGPYIVTKDGKYVPASTYGIAAGSAIISAHYLNKAKDDLKNGDLFGAASNSTVGPLWATLRASGMDNTLSGNNMFAGLPASVGQVANNPNKDAGDITKTIAGGLIGDVGSQGVPAVLRDIDAFFNQNPNYNPTGEKPDTSGKDPETGKVDPIRKGIAQIKSGIPGLSDDLPRKSGALARDFGGRILNANTQSDQQKAAIAADKDEETTTINRTADVVKDDKVAGLLSEETRAIYDKYKGDMSKASQEDSKKIWKEVTEAKDRLLDDGSYDSYGKILTYERDEAKAKGSSTPTEIAEMDRKITRSKVASEKKTKPQIFRLYTGTDTPEGGGLSASEFKKMLQLDDDGNPKYPDLYDPETATLLWELDEAMTKAGASANTNGLDPWKRNKYNLDEALGRGKYASKGSGGGKDKGIGTDFGTIGAYAKSPGGQSQKYQKIANSGSPLANLTKSSSKTNLRKNISVVKGVRL